MKQIELLSPINVTKGYSEEVDQRQPRSSILLDFYKDKGIDISLSRFEIDIEVYKKLDSEPDYHKSYGYSVGHKGFFILDEVSFNETLEAYQTKDLNQRKIDLDIFFKKYPEDSKKDEFKKLIIEPNKNTFFWNRVIQDECVYDITKKSLFCTTEGIRQILEHDSNNRKELALEYQLPESLMYVHGLINKPETANEFYIINKQINTEEELQKITSNSKEKVEVGTVKIENKKIGFFHPNDFNVNNKDDYKQRFFKCENGEYKIKAFFDKNFENNFNTMKEFKKLSSDYEEEYDDSVQKLFGYPGELDTHDLEQNDERVIALKTKFDDQVKSLRKKYLIENIGCLYFQIKKEKNS